MIERNFKSMICQIQGLRGEKFHLGWKMNEMKKIRPEKSVLKNMFIGSMLQVLLPTPEFLLSSGDVVSARSREKREKEGKEEGRENLFFCCDQLRQKLLHILWLKKKAKKKKR